MDLRRMMRACTAVLVLATPLLFVASSAPAAETQAMSGPQNACCLDNFNRADENPLSGGGNWAPLNPGVYLNDLELSNLHVTAIPVNGDAVAARYWTPRTYGPDSEVYYRLVGPGVDIGENWRLMLRRLALPVIGGTCGTRAFVSLKT